MRRNRVHVYSNEFAAAQEPLGPAVKREKGESCNCGLTPEEETDIHFALVDEPEDDEETSIKAEVTPRVRHAGVDRLLYQA
jgi:hypothetical protein